MPQSTVDDLTALGLNLDQIIAALGKVNGILSTANYCIYRQRHANTAAAPRAAAARAPHRHAVSMRLAHGGLGRGHGDDSLRRHRR